MTMLATVAVLVNPAAITGDPMIFTTIPNPRGLLIGLTCGVLLWLAPYLGSPEGEPVGLAGRLSEVFGFAIAGAIVGGFVRMTGCLTAAGAVIGLIILGMLCDRAIGHPQGVVYGILLGGSLGGFAGYILGTRLEWAMAQLSKDSPAPPAAGVWDREIDG
jgi:hypothetical protein